AAPIADSDGYWAANGIPVNTYDIVAVSFDGKRKGERRDVLASGGAVAQVNVALQGVSVVVGRVENSVGAPVANALVAGGEAIVHTDANGVFRLTGVPTGLRGI